MNFPRKHATRFAALAAAATLALSGCGAIIPTLLSPKSQSATSSSTSTSSASSTQASSGSTSTAYGTDGMAPMPTLPKPAQSGAMGINVDTATDPRWADYYKQKPTWGSCENPEYAAAECARVEVPLKWNEPEGQRISLLVTRLKSADPSLRKGSLIMNPGGPGGSGAQFVAAYGTQATTQNLRKYYDLIGFDPRGVKDSAPVKCLNDSETDALLSSTYDPTTAEGKKQAEEWNKKVADACKQNSGDILQYVDTYSTARDMDVIRAVVESPKLDYLGFSYGTYLGATYADLYPSRTGHLVLDGAIDPALNDDEMAAGQAKGFENEVHAFMKWCLNDRGSCPFTGTEDEGVKQLQDLVKKIDETPLPTKSGRQLTGALATTAILSTLYSDSTWEFLALGIQEAQQGNGDTLLLLADLLNERNSDGHYESNGTFAITAINCLDHQGITDQTWVDNEQKRLAEKFPTFGSLLGGSGIVCSQWPAKTVRAPGAIHAKGSAPILVIGTKGDPATPYPWAQALDKELDNSVLLTYEGHGHTAYTRSGGCIENYVDDYLINDAMPAAGTSCQAQSQ